MEVGGFCLSGDETWFCTGGWKLFFWLKVVDIVDLPFLTQRSWRTSCALNFSFVFSFLFLMQSFSEIFERFGFKFILPSILVGGEVAFQDPAPLPTPRC